MNQSELQLVGKRGKSRVITARLAYVLHLIGWNKYLFLIAENA